MGLYWSGIDANGREMWREAQDRRLKWSANGSGWSVVLALACQVIVLSLSVLATLAYVYLTR